MPLDRARLTREEREELRRALVARRRDLARLVENRVSEHSKSDARWRAFVVESLLAEIDG